MRFGLTLMALILAACAMFFPAPTDMTHGHLTGASLTEAEARTILQRGRSTQFDPEVVDVFLLLCPPLPQGDPSALKAEDPVRASRRKSRRWNLPRPM